MKLKKFSAVTFILFFSLNAFCQTLSNSYNLDDILCDWFLVPGGNAVCDPVKTSYGYAALLEGKNLYAFSNDGNILWQKTFSTAVKPFLSSGYSDLLFLVTGKNGNQITVLNPDGSVIFSEDTGFEIKCRPFQGKDGRIFVYGKNEAACYGLNGIRKWKIQTGSTEENLEPVEMNDGSILFFLSSAGDVKTKGLRVSPFGKKLETITFAGSVKQSAACKNGILLLFRDGQTGFMAAEKKSSESKWVLNLSVPAAFIVPETPSSKPAIITASSPARFYFADTATGELTSSLLLPELNVSEIKEIKAGENGIFIRDRKNCVFISPEEKVIWSAILPAGKKAEHSFVTDSGYLVLFSNDWSLTAWRMKQTLSSKKTVASNKTKPSHYSSWYMEYLEASSWNMGKLIQNPAETRRLLLNGNYGENETVILSRLYKDISKADSDFSSGSGKYSPEPFFFTTNIDYTQSVFLLASITGTAVFQKSAARVLSKAADSSVELTIVNAAANFGYDEDLSLLKEISLLFPRISPDDTVFLTSICDSIYSITRYMGRRAFFEYGQDILLQLLSPPYNSRIHDYAVITLAKISRL